jgi:predicted tellurium resistance membrane protein TerC
MGYIEQYKMIRDTQKVGSFSTDICAILLIANIIRIYYWFATGFGLALLFQAILMICAQVPESRNLVAVAQDMCGCQSEAGAAKGASH